MFTKKVLQSLHQKLRGGLVNLDTLRNSEHYSGESEKIQEGIELIKDDLVNAMLESNILANDLE